MRLGTQDKDFFPKGLTEKFIHIKRMGFDCFEIDGKVLSENTIEVKEAIMASGLPIVSACGGYRGWIGDFIEERRLNAIEDLKGIIRALAEVGGKCVVVPAAWGMFTYRLPPMVSPRSQEGDRKTILDSLKELDPVAKECGITICLEPLNRYQDHMLNTLKDASDVIEAGGFEAVKITADFYHMAIEEDDMRKSLEKYSKYIGHVHIAENHRYQPGTGSMDFDILLGTLKDIGYDGAVVYECRVRGEDPERAYRESVEYMRRFI
ncbi:sugar phosphate isomerase/epimerase family protein [Youngiibacter multivorans]|uniref:Sugar phosphate isomerase/epimerase n=1 Tax=Youngiibacter multivorans TaxID=937251 RepID=A0ABS4G468_9CLOT|nr:sugar phosphate isomerase/epimerase [Youngiibacter multivorans]MBP1919353.1 sugar phosphate isomerase/epimerase [Youngiibacter multivorans]